MRAASSAARVTRFPAVCTALAPSVVNALSKHLKVTVYQDGKIYQQEYARGKVLYDLKVIGETDRTGTTIQFWPDSRDERQP